MSIIQTTAAPHQQGSLTEDGGLDALEKTVQANVKHMHGYEISVQYRNLTFWNELPELSIATVGTTLMGTGSKNNRVNIINDLTGRILPKRMTLVMGPPGSGKSAAWL